MPAVSKAALVASLWPPSHTFSTSGLNVITSKNPETCSEPKLRLSLISFISTASHKETCCLIDCHVISSLFWTRFEEKARGASGI